MAPGGPCRRVQLKDQALLEMLQLLVYKYGDGLVEEKERRKGEITDPGYRLEKKREEYVQVERGW